MVISFEGQQSVYMFYPNWNGLLVLNNSDYNNYKTNIFTVWLQNSDCVLGM